MTRIIFIILLLLTINSCDKWTAVPIETNEDYASSAIELLNDEKQNYYSLASATFNGDDLISQNMVSIELTDGVTSWEVGAGTPGYGKRVRTQTSGILTMVFEIRSPDRSTISQGSVSVSLKPDSRISFTIYRNHYVRPCYGCAGSRSFPITNH